MGAAPVLRAQLAPPAVGTARAYAQVLLDSLGAVSARPLDLPDEHPALSWARSGLMALTGSPDGEPQMCPAPLAACADGALAALASLAPADAFNNLRGSRLLAERAAIASHARAGRTSPGGSCRLLETADGGIALNLARNDDWALLPAWLECEVAPDWESVARIIRFRLAQELVQRGRLLGLAIAADEMPGWATAPWFSDCRVRTAHHSATLGAQCAAYERTGKHKPLVVDLSSLWAGPLCSHLLQRMGAEVIKVESLQRPDGARNGPPAFFDLLNAGKRSVVLDFATPGGRDQLRALLAQADIVIEASRPRALRQLGIRAESLIAENPRLTWISITGYGRGEAENWIAYGDDAAVAAGLSRLMFEASGEHLMVGDAIADPLTGLHAALAAWAGFLRGGGGLISLSLADVLRHCIAFDLPSSTESLQARQREWSALARNHVASPSARTSKTGIHT